MNRFLASLLPPRLRPRLRPPLHPAPMETASPLDALIGLSPERAYTASPWVYAAVTRIAEAAALVPLRVYRIADGERVLLPDHPLLALLNAPSHTLSRFDLIESTIGTLELGGNAYWYLAGDADGLPAAIYPLAPARVRIVPDPVDGVRGYVYEFDGVRVPLDPLEVVHFRRWHPGSDHYGLSALEAARLAIQADRAMAEWNRSTFAQDHAVPAGIVAVREYISDADFERLKREWRASYGGGQRKTAFLRGASIEWQHIGLNHVDLDFLRGRQAIRDEIFTIFGIPLGLIDANATEANAVVAERQFIERTLWPKLVRMAEKISRDLLPFWADQYGLCAAEFDDIRWSDDQARLEELRLVAALPGVLTADEIRARYFNLGPVARAESSAPVTPDGSGSGSAPAA